MDIFGLLKYWGWYKADNKGKGISFVSFMDYLEEQNEVGGGL